MSYKYFILGLAFLAMTSVAQAQNAMPNNIAITKKNIQGSWYVKNNPERLEFKFLKNVVIETIDKKSNKYGYCITSSLIYEGDTIKTQKGQLMLSFLIDNKVAYYYYISSITKNKMYLQSGFNMQPIVYNKN